MARDRRLGEERKVLGQGRRDSGVIHILLFHLWFYLVPLEKCILLPLWKHDNIFYR